MTRPIPPYRTVRDLLYRYRGRPAVVLGGGPSLAAVDKAPPPTDAIYVSANDHGCRVAACHYVVGLDKIRARLEACHLPIIGRFGWADYRILESPAPSSGIAGAWIARLMGCGPIWLLGMDCYEGASYHHDPAAETNGKATPPKEHVNRWSKFVRRYPADYREVRQGILSGVLSTGRAPEGFVPAAPALEQELAGTFVQFRNDALLDKMQRSFLAGEIAEVRKKEAEILIKGKRARKWSAAA